MMWNFNSKNIAFIENSDDHKSISYNELEIEAKKLYEVIDERCLVFSLCKNTIGALIGYTSFISNKVVPLLLGSDISEEMLLNLIEIYSPNFIWLPENSEFDFNKYKVVYSAFGYILLKTEFSKVDMDNSLGLLLSTSGSTASPKLVRLSYRNIESNMKSIVEYLNITQEERPITTLPFNYTYGLSVINSHLAKNSTILLNDYSVVDKNFWSFLKEYEATSISGVPYTYEILDKLRFYKMELKHLKTLTQAGGRLSEELQKKYVDYALKNEKEFVVMYGQTEATARISYLPFKESLNKIGSIGVAIPNGKICIYDEDKEITEANLVGELVYFGENASLGYAECRTDLAKPDENFGKIFTGDLAYFDEDGFYYIVGRKKRFLKVFGNRINLDELENYMKNFYNIDCCATGVDDELVIIIDGDYDDVFFESITNGISSKYHLSKLYFKIGCGKIYRSQSGKILYSKTFDSFKNGD